MGYWRIVQHAATSGGIMATTRDRTMVYWPNGLKPQAERRAAEMKISLSAWVAKLAEAELARLDRKARAKTEATK